MSVLPLLLSCAFDPVHFLWLSVLGTYCVRPPTEPSARLLVTLSPSIRPPDGSCAFVPSCLSVCLFVCSFVCLFTYPPARSGNQETPHGRQQDELPPRLEEQLVVYYTPLPHHTDKSTLKLRYALDARRNGKRTQARLVFFPLCAPVCVCVSWDGSFRFFTSTRIYHRTPITNPSP